MSLFLPVSSGLSLLKPDDIMRHTMQLFFSLTKWFSSCNAYIHTHTSLNTLNILNTQTYGIVFMHVYLVMHYVERAVL